MHPTELAGLEIPRILESWRSNILESWVRLQRVGWDNHLEAKVIMVKTSTSDRLDIRREAAAHMSILVVLRPQALLDHLLLPTR